MTEIWLEGKRVDVRMGDPVLMTFSVDDIRDFSSRNTTFSKTIILPGTANNNRLFGHIFDVRVSNPYSETSDNVETNFNAAVQASCVIFNDRIQVFKGTLRILQITIIGQDIEYEVSVFGELGGLVGAMASLKLEDLDFSDYNEAWTTTNIQDSWDNASGGSGLYYPLLDYGGVSTAKVDWDFRAFRPALFVREYIDKIITDAGYTWQSSLFDTARFKSLVIPNNQKALQTLTTRLLEGIGVSTNTVIQNGVDDDNVMNTDINTLSQFTYASGVFTYTGTDTRTFRLNAVINGDYYSTIDSIQLGYRKNGSTFYTQVPFLSPTFGTTDTNFTKTFDEQYVTLSTGDTLSIFAKITNNVGSYRLRTTFINFTANVANSVYADVAYGGTIAINDTLPKNILQKDFLSSIVKLFNLYIYEDPLYPRKLLITPYVDFYSTDVSGFTDWTYKVDRSKAVIIKPMSELNSRYYNFKFRPDKDYYSDEVYFKRYNSGYGDRIYDSQYEMANETTDIDVIFSPGVLVGYAGVDKIVTAIYKRTNGVEEAIAHNIRILQAKKITGVTSWAIKDGSTTKVSGLTAYGYGGHYDDPDAPANDINFGVPEELYFTLLSGSINVTQFNVYWSPYMAEIADKDSKLMTCFIKLTAADIYKLDFRVPIFIDGAYWRLNKIEDWNASEPDVTKVELLKIINLFY